MVITVLTPQISLDFISLILSNLLFPGWSSYFHDVHHGTTNRVRWNWAAVPGLEIPERQERRVCFIEIILAVFSFISLII